MASVQRLFDDDAAGTAASRPSLRIQLLGPLTVVREGEGVALPASRKLRGLLAYLVLARGAVGRSRLCEMLWDRPSDPRGELRWCLSKLRCALGAAHRQRIYTRGDAVGFDAEGCEVDIVEIEQALRLDARALGCTQRRRRCGRFAGELLEGLDMTRSPHFDAWLTAQRRCFRGIHAALLRRLSTAAPDDEAVRYLERWLDIAPFDPEPHELLIAALVRRHRVHEAEAHVAAASRRFEAEGLDPRPLRLASRSARLQVASLRQTLELVA